MPATTIDVDKRLAPQPVAPRTVLADDTQRIPIGQQLIDAGLIRQDQLDTALRHQESSQQSANSDGSFAAPTKRLGEIVAELGLVDESNLLPLLGEQLGVAGVRLREGLIDPNAVRMIPREHAERLLALPLMRVRDELTVAMADPHDIAAIDTLARISGCRIRPVFTLAVGINRLLPRCYEEDFSVDSVTAWVGIV